MYGRFIKDELKIGTGSNNSSKIHDTFEFQQEAEKSNEPKYWGASRTKTQRVQKMVLS